MLVEIIHGCRAPDEPQELNHVTGHKTPVAYFTNAVSPRLEKLWLKFNGALTNLGVTSLVK